MNRTLANILVLNFIFFNAAVSYAQTAGEKEEPIKFGDMEHWITRHIHESAIIGGKTKTLYEIVPDKTIEGNKPYVNMGGSPWGTSNVMAKVSGIVKTNNTVYKDRHDNGFCVKMETHIEKVKVLGLIKINVLAAGSIFLGDMKEPITGTKEGPKAMNWGIKFNKRPKAIRYDYRMKLSGEKDRIKLTGFSGRSTVKGKDHGITVLFLQKRTEDSNGNITAKYDPSTMALRSTDYARNSKGEHVLVKETGWASSDETPTHLLLQFSSSDGGAYIGSPGNTLWVDNVRLVY